MQRISLYQLKAARAMLDWSRKDVAEATGLDPNTIRNIENGFISPRATTNNVLHHVFGKAGLEFIEDDGVKRRKGQAKVYDGIHSYDNFFADVVQTIEKDDNDILMSIKSPEVAGLLFNGSNSRMLRYLSNLNDIADIKCLLAEKPQSLHAQSQIPLRVAKQNITRLPCFVYGNKYAMMMLDDFSSAQFLVFYIPHAAQTYRNEFLAFWNKSKAI